jgi:hypothetical protein
MSMSRQWYPMEDMRHTGADSGFAIEWFAAYSDRICEMRGLAWCDGSKYE